MRSYSTRSPWRKALRVCENNVGTRRLRREYSKEDYFDANRRKSHKARWTPAKREHSRKLRGRPRPASVREAIRKALQGRKFDESRRAKLRAAWRRRKQVASRRNPAPGASP